MRNHLLTTRLLLVLGVAVPSACSLLNREGPDVTCEQLGNGKGTACSHGIIASCVDGSLVYTVCADSNVCSASWQAEYYRCSEDGDTVGPPAIASCTPYYGVCPSGYRFAAEVYNNVCGTCTTENLCVLPSVDFTVEDGPCPAGTHAILSAADIGDQCAGSWTRRICAK